MHSHLQNYTQYIKLMVVLCVLLFSFTAAQALAATLSVSPGTGVYTAGATFNARVLVNTKGTSINAAEGTLKFNPNELTVIGVSKGPIFGLWAVEPAFSNSAGTITFGGGSPTGYTGGAGAVINISFRVKAAGTAKVTFQNGSVLAADGRGTNVLTSMNGGSYTTAAAAAVPEAEVIEYVATANTPAAPVIKSSTHPDPAGWYSETVAKLSWNVPSGVTAVRTLLGSSPSSVPTKVYDTPISSITLDDLDEGLQYFHLQFKNDEGWGRVTHYRLAVDTQKPISFNIALGENADLSNPTQDLVLDVEDEGSGVEKYIVQIDGGEAYEWKPESASSTLTLPALDPGYHAVIIEAFDFAGNSIISSFSFTVLAFDRPQFTEYPTELNTGVIPVIKGVTRPNAQVTVTMSTPGSSALEQVYEVVSDESGTFTFIPDAALTTGVYTLTAIATDQFGAKSEVSEEVKIVVQESGYLRLGAWAVSVLSVLVPLVALAVLLILLVLYFLRRFKKVRTYVIAETDEALDVLKREFVNLQDELSSHEAKLTGARKTKKLTKNEAALVSDLSSALTQAESTIRKEIADVDDVVAKKSKNKSSKAKSSQPKAATRQLKAKGQSLKAKSKKLSVTEEK